jgi:hypothetical protein
MIRLAWLQARSQAAVATLGLLIVAVAAAITGPHLAHQYAADVAPCLGHGNCDIQVHGFLNHYVFFQNTLDQLMRITPGLVGIFWGAPLLARELETGTFRLAWTQSVTRTRWLASKLIIGVVAAGLIGGLLSLTTTWWYRALDKVGTNQYEVFDRRGIAIIGYTVFAFAIGALSGVVIRRTLPAMAAGLSAFIFARVAVMLWVRPHLFSPLHKTFSVVDSVRFGFISQNGGPVALQADAPDIPNAWIQSTHLVTSSGHVATFAERVAFVKQYCAAAASAPPPIPLGGGSGKPVRGPAPEGILVCRQKAAEIYHVLVSYQPAGRWVTFQWLEFGIFMGLAALAIAGCYWWVTRRAG